MIYTPILDLIDLVWLIWWFNIHLLNITLLLSKYTIILINLYLLINLWLLHITIWFILQFLHIISESRNILLLNIFIIILEVYFLITFLLRMHEWPFELTTLTTSVVITWSITLNLLNLLFILIHTIPVITCSTHQYLRTTWLIIQSRSIH